MNKYMQDLENIKNYLHKEGIPVDTVVRWQGGFQHEGSPYYLEIIATVEINGVEERYCIPRYVVNPKKLTGEPLKFLKI